MSLLIMKLSEIFSAQSTMKKVLPVLVGSALVSLLSACGGGSSSGTSCTGSCSNTVSGLQAGGVKGPLTNASWELFQAGSTTPLAEGDDETDFLFDLGDQIPDDVSTPLLLELDVASAIDATTGAAPVVTTLRTLVSQAMLDSGNPIIVTPLSTVAANILIAERVDVVNGPLSFAEFGPADLTALINGRDAASAQVMAVFGLGATQAIDVFTQAPVFLPSDDGGVVSSDELEKIVQFRKANEAFATSLFNAAAIVGGGATATTVFDNVVAAFDNRLLDAIEDTQAGVSEFIGELNAVTDSTVIANSSPASTIGDVQTLALGTGAAATIPETGEALDPATQTLIAAIPPSMPLVPLPVAIPIPVVSVIGDADGDGEPDASDVRPFDPAIQTAAQLISNDGDNVPDIFDNCVAGNAGVFAGSSLVNEDQSDIDGDGFGDACDSDPLDPAFFDDQDKDGLGTALDNCPLVANGPLQSSPLADDHPLAPGVDNQTNIDGDSQGDACDADDDNDGVNDAADDAQFLAIVTSDADGDGIDDIGGNSPNGTALNGPDNCPIPNPEQTNLDLALVGPDGDDTDDADADIDGIIESGAFFGVALDVTQANTYLTFGPIQADALGDACDDDADGDGLVGDDDSIDFNPDTNALSTDDDEDTDGVPNTLDNCPNNGNPLQTNSDGDELIDPNGIGIGDACDVDDDNDGLLDADDPDSTSAAFPVFLDVLSVGLKGSPGNDLFALIVGSESDAPADGSGVSLAANNVLNLDRGALTDGGGNLDGSGLAGDDPQSVQVMRDSQPLATDIEFAGTSCGSADSCSLGGTSVATVASAGSAASPSMPNSFDVPVANYSFANSIASASLDFNESRLLTNLSGSQLIAVSGATTPVSQLGSSFVGVDSSITTLYNLDDDCETAVFGAPIASNTEGNVLAAIDLLSDIDVAIAAAAASVDCDVISQQQLENLRVVAEQAEGGAQQLGLASEYGLIEYSVSFNDSAANQLVQISTNVSAAGGGSASSFFDTVSGFDMGTIQFSNANAPVRSLTPLANEGSITLGTLSGFADRTGDLLTLVDFAADASPNNTDQIGRAYALKYTDISDASQLDGLSYDLRGSFITSDEEGVAVSGWDVSTLTFSDQGGGSIVATLMNRPSTTETNFREGEQLLPSIAESKTLATLLGTSDPITITNGRFDPITFSAVPAIAGLELEGFYSTEGLLLRVVNTLAVKEAIGGGPSTGNNILVLDWDDSVGSVPNVPEDGEPTRVFAYADDAAACGALGEASDCTPSDFNGRLISTFIGSEFVISPFYASLELEANFDVNADNLGDPGGIVQGGGGGASIGNNMLVLDWDDSVGSVPNVPEDGEPTRVFAYANDAAACGALGEASDCTPSDFNGRLISTFIGSEFVISPFYASLALNAGFDVNSDNLGDPAGIVQSGGGDSLFGFTAVARSNIGTPVGESVVNAAGGPETSYDSYSFGQGILLGVPTSSQ